ncbi:MAG: type II secretion system F family protein, partial [Bdellovibrionales bacterium]
MPIFAFQAKQMDGRGVKGEIEASSEVEARVKIRAQQMIPIKVVASNGAGGGTSLGNMFSGKGGVSGLLIPKVKTKDLKVFTRQFATLINSGVAVVQSLELLERSSSNPTLKLCLTKIRQDISMGKKLADSMA